MTSDDVAQLDKKLTTLAAELATIKQDPQTLHLRLARMETQREQTITAELNLEAFPKNFQDFITKYDRFASQIKHMNQTLQTLVVTKNVEKIRHGSN